MKQVLVGVLSQDMVHADFAFSLSRMLVYCSEYCRDSFRVAGIIDERGCYLDQGRNRVVLKAMAYVRKSGLAPESVHLLFLDSDMVFPQNTLQKLVDERETIVGCNYERRRDPWGPVGKIVNGKWELGCGCMLIRMDVFTKIEFPYFQEYYDRDGKVGEDVDFCRKATLAGFTVACDQELSPEIGHVGMTMYKLGTSAKLN